MWSVEQLELRICGLALFKGDRIFFTQGDLVDRHSCRGIRLGGISVMDVYSEVRVLSIGERHQ
jgi:hypothetical protein